MNEIRFLGLAAVLLLGGCLEATDSITGSLRARGDYCVVPPDAVVLCPEKPPQAPIFPRRSAVVSGTVAGK